MKEFFNNQNEKDISINDTIRKSYLDFYNSRLDSGYTEEEIIYDLVMYLGELLDSNFKSFQTQINLIWSDAYKVLKQKRKNNMLNNIDIQLQDKVNSTEGLDDFFINYVLDTELVCNLLPHFFTFIQYNDLGKTNCLMSLNSEDHQNLITLDKFYLLDILKYRAEINPNKFLEFYNSQILNGAIAIQVVDEIKYFLLNLKKFDSKNYKNNLKEILWTDYKHIKYLVENNIFEELTANAVDVLQAIERKSFNELEDDSINNEYFLFDLISYYIEYNLEGKSINIKSNEEVSEYIEGQTDQKVKIKLGI